MRKTLITMLACIELIFRGLSKTAHTVLYNARKRWNRGQRDQPMYLGSPVIFVLVLDQFRPAIHPSFSNFAAVPPRIASADSGGIPDARTRSIYLRMSGTPLPLCAA